MQSSRKSFCRLKLLAAVGLELVLIIRAASCFETAAALLRIVDFKTCITLPRLADTIDLLT